MKENEHDFLTKVARDLIKGGHFDLAFKFIMIPTLVISGIKYSPESCYIIIICFFSIVSFLGIGYNKFAKKPRPKPPYPGIH